MPLSKLRPTFTLTEDRLQELQAVVPEAFADGKVDWEALQTALGEYLEDPAAEHFGLTWPGKREARRLAALPPQGALLPQPGLGANEDTTHNLFIEADNLEALKLLLKAYAGRVKLIYIDPPYNTGNDFVYPDDYSQPLEAYLRQTGQADEQGRRLTTNLRAAGRYHSNWLNMIYPRLLLARQLLQEDGLLIVSIDDNEFNKLGLILNEIFGEENFIQCLVWKKRYNAAKEKYIASIHEYVFVYAKNISILDPMYIPRNEEQIREQFTLRDEYFETRGPYMTQPLEAGNSMDDRNNLVYPIPAPDGTDLFPRRQWIWSRERAYEALKNGLLEFKKGKDGKWSVRWKYYLLDDEGRVRGQKPFSIIEDIYNQEGTKEVADIFGDGNLFSFPKPSVLIEHLINITNVASNEIILDFFAGSCTTAHAVLNKNRQDGGTRRFIMVQLPEPTPPESVARKSGYATIADIGRERIRRVIQRIKKEQPTLTSSSADLGFRSFKLGRSHFTPWQPQAASQPAQLELQLQTAAGPLRPGWQPADLLPEILLIEGFPLDSRVRPLPAYPENQVVEVSHDFCAHRLTICLDETLSAATLAALLQLHPEDTFICLDSALDDESKLRLADRCNLKVI